jgi:polyisoprenoid-binding protein YceI
MRKIASSLFALLALAIPAVAAETYEIDKSHSSVTFTVRHMLVSNVPGRFSDVSGTIIYDEQDPSKSSVNTVIKAASINTDHEGRDKHLRGADFFDADKYPEITFRSRRVEKRGEQLVAIGDLTIKDVTKEVELPFEIAKVKTRSGELVGVTTSTRINRQAYNVKYNSILEGGGVAISDDVKIEISLEARPLKPVAAEASAK